MPCLGVPLRLTKGVSTWPIAATCRVLNDCVGMRSLCLLRFRKAASARVLPFLSSFLSCCSLSSRLRRCQA